MARIAQLTTELDAKVIQFNRKMDGATKRAAEATKRIQQLHDRAADNVNRSWQKADLDKGFQRQIKSVNGLRDSLQTLAPALAAALSVQGALAAADTFTRFTNQLKIAGLEGEALASIQDKLFETAKNAGIGVEALGTLYARTSAAGKDLGANQSQLLAVTDAVALSLKVGGQSAEASQGALLQLGQALGAPQIQAQEYNSLLDGMPALLGAMAEASTKYGGSLAKMTADVKAGNVSNKEFFDLIIAALPALQGKAAQATSTFGQAMQTLQTSLVQYIGQTDSSLEITERMAGAIVLLSNNLDTVATAITIVAGILTTRMVAGLATTAGTAALARVQIGLLSAGLAGMSASATAGAAAMTGLRGAMSFLGGPVGVAVLALTAAVAGLAHVAGDAERDAKKLTEEFNRQHPAASKLVEATKQLELAQGAQRKEALEATKQAKIQAEAELKNAEAKLQSAKASLALMQAEHLRKVDSGRLDPEAATGQMANMGASERRKGLEIKELETLVADRQKAIKAAEAAIAAAGKPAGGGAASTGKPSKASGPSKAELADRRAALDLENQLLIARARGNEAEITALEEKQELLRLIEQFERTGLKTAEARAAAEGVMLEKAYARLAYLRENPTISAARSPDMNPDGLVLTSEGIGKHAEALADQQDELREGFKDALRGGLDAAFQEGWPGVAEYIAQSLRQRLLDNLLDVMANLAFPQGGNSSGGFFSSIASIFGGARATGGPVSPGKVYRINENGQEFFAPNVAGKIIPAGQLGVPAGARGTGGATYNLTTVVNADGAVMAGQIRNEIAAANMQTLQAARQLSRADAARAGMKQLGRR